VRWGLVAVLAVLIFGPAAAAAPPVISIQATPVAGAAPLQVTFTAVGEAALYHWEFGDGASADGKTVEHTYAAGRWTVTLTASSAAGERATASAVVTASGVTLSGPSIARYDRRVRFRGVVLPAESRVPVTLVGPGGGKIAAAKTRGDGSYVVTARVRLPGAYQASSVRGASAPVTLRVVPKLTARFSGSGVRGSTLAFRARLVPARAGTLAVKVSRGATVVVERTAANSVRIALDTRRLATYVVRVEVLPADGYAATARRLRASVVLPRLALGSRGSPVAQLGRRLRQLHYAAPIGGAFDGRLLDAVFAFQKVNRLPRTGVVEARFWQALANPRLPLPRFAQPSTHLEVNKPLQVLYVVRSGKVALIVPISTAGVAGAFTPVGRFAVYRKVGGFDPSPLGTLYDPLYFTGGYAIHGNPSVPPYPASHGCVRVPMWVAPQLYRTVPYGETVYVY
jgi:PKD repeat protein